MTVIAIIEHYVKNVDHGNGQKKIIRNVRTRKKMAQCSAMYII